MAKKNRKQELKDQAGKSFLKIREVRGYLLTSPHEFTEGKFCQDLDSVERYLNSLKDEDNG